MNVLLIGQSNANRWFHPHQGAAGAKAFVGAFERAGRKVNLVNAAVGGTSLLPRNRRQGYWLDTAPGSLYANAIQKARNAGKIDAVIWIQGEGDARDGMSSRDYQRGLDTLFSRLRRDLGPVPIYMQPLMMFTFAGAQGIREAQLAYASSDPRTKLVEPNMGRLRSEDGIHFTAESYEIIARKFARRIMRDVPGAQNVGLLAGGDMSLLR